MTLSNKPDPARWSSTDLRWKQERWYSKKKSELCKKVLRTLSLYSKKPLLESDDCQVSLYLRLALTPKGAIIFHSRSDYSHFSEVCLYLPLRKLQEEWVQAFGTMICGFVWVDRCYLWLVDLLYLLATLTQSSLVRSIHTIPKIFSPNARTCSHCSLKE